MPKMMLFFNVSSFKNGYFGYPRWFSGAYSNSKRHLHKWLGDSHGWSRKPDRSLRSFFLQLRSWDLRPLRESSSRFLYQKIGSPEEIGGKNLLVLRPQITIPKNIKLLNTFACNSMKPYKLVQISMNLEEHQTTFFQDFGRKIPPGDYSHICIACEPGRWITTSEVWALAVVCWVCRG